MAQRPRQDEGHPERPVGEDELTVQMEINGDWTLLHVAGALDLHTVPLLVARLELAAEVTEPPNIAVEISELRFCDSSGLNLLVRTHKRVLAKGGRLLLIRPADQVKKLLKWTGLYRVFDIRPAVVPQPT
jgi:anti-sigma B factor antagonist